MFLLCASSLPSSRVRRTRFVRREQGFWLVPYVLGLGGFPSATVVASHSGGAPGGCRVDRSMRSFPRRLPHGTPFCTFLLLLAFFVDSPHTNAAYHLLMYRVSVLACRGFVLGTGASRIGVQWFYVRDMGDSGSYRQLVGSMLMLGERMASCAECVMPPILDPSAWIFGTVNFRTWIPHGRRDSVCMVFTLTPAGP